VYALHHRSRIFCQTPIKHIINACEPLHVISIKHGLSLPDDGLILFDPKHVGVIFNACLLDFYITQILISTIVLI
jgi:hypothetical protein